MSILREWFCGGQGGSKALTKAQQSIIRKLAVLVNGHWSWEVSDTLKTGEHDDEYASAHEKSSAGNNDLSSRARQEYRVIAINSASRILSEIEALCSAPCAPGCTTAVFEILYSVFACAFAALSNSSQSGKRASTAFGLSESIPCTDGNSDDEMPKSPRQRTYDACVGAHRRPGVQWNCHDRIIETIWDASSEYMTNSDLVAWHGGAAEGARCFTCSQSLLLGSDAVYTKGLPCRLSTCNCCGYHCHEHCLRDHLTRCASCPVCKCPIDDEDVLGVDSAHLVCEASSVHARYANCFAYASLTGMISPEFVHNPGIEWCSHAAFLVHPSSEGVGVGEEKCAICWGELNSLEERWEKGSPVRLRKCSCSRYAFHERCLRQHLLLSPSCPMCRAPVDLIRLGIEDKREDKRKDSWDAAKDIISRVILRFDFMMEPRLGGEQRPLHAPDTFPRRLPFTTRVI